MRDKILMKGGTPVDGYPLKYSCKICQREIEINDENLPSSVGYLCHHCENFVAIIFEEELVQPETVLDLNWNENIYKRAKEIDENLFVVEGSGIKDGLVLKVLHYPAREYDFRKPDPEEQQYLLLFNSEKYLGFIVWEQYYDTGGDNLQQIYIIDSERKKGNGSKFLKFWVENCAKKVENVPDRAKNDSFLGKFGVEINDWSPLWDILVDLGYAKKTGEHFVSINFFPTHSS